MTQIGMLKEADTAVNEPLAIVGIGCRLPGGVVDAETFWVFLAEGRSGIVEVPKNRWNNDRVYHPDATIPGRMQTRWGGFVDNLDEFDARFWGITPREAMRLDPQQRWLLEVAWEAIEDSGAAPSALRGQRVGCFVGIATHDYSVIQGDLGLADAHTNSGIALSIAANRVSYLLDLKGPSLSVDTACSSSLVALSLACRSIWAGDCDAALVGGVNAMCTPHATMGFAKASMLSPDGQCFAFDRRANGYVRGEGAGMVYFKRLGKALLDNDPIYAVIRAAVINQDGHTSSMTVPCPDAQAAMLRKAYQEAGIPPQHVVYMEAHGTGTPVGDPIEASALGRVLSQDRADDQRCLIGSVKSNIGHLEAGSGIAGLIKAALILHRDQVPPNANFETPNPNIPFDELKLQVAEQLTALPHPNGALPVAAVNSFGFGGTNSHAVLQAPPQRAMQAKKTTIRAHRPYVLPISARDPDALSHYVRAFHQYLQDTEESLADICYSAGQRKEHHEERIVFSGDSADEIRQRMTQWLDPQREDSVDVDGVSEGRATELALPVFVFTGQGAQWWAMGQQLIQREPVFRATLETIDEKISALGDYSLIEEMNRSEDKSRIDDTNIAQPAIFALQVGLAELWHSWGIVPAKVVGHSVGEVAAAYVAGIYNLDDAVGIIFHRSRLQNTTAGQGKMVAVGMSSRAARRLIGNNSDVVQIAAVNSANLVTLAGETEALKRIVDKLEADGKFTRWLPVNYPFHTHFMDPIQAELLDVLRDIQPQRARIPFVSTVTGGLYQGEKMDAAYWWSNVRQSVLFAPAINNLVNNGDDFFLELGPHPALKTSVNECLTDKGKQGRVLHSLRRKTDETTELLTNLAELHIHGAAGIDWAAVNQSAGRFTRLPRYPWNYEKYWLESFEMAHRRLDPDTHPLLGQRQSAVHPTWEFDLDPRVFTWLESHRFWDSILFPAAGYGEIALALARAVFPDEEYTVEDLEVKKALFVSENNVPRVRIDFNAADKSFTICSATGNKQEWDLHVTGRLTLYNSPRPSKVDLEKLRERLPKHVTHQQLYKALDDAGYHFGPHFKLIRNVWRGPREALSEVFLPSEEMALASDHFFHSVLLDACLQAARGAIDPEQKAAGDLYLPRRLGRIRFYCERVPERFWAYAKETRDDGVFMHFDINVYDDEGNRVCDILDFKSELMEHIRDSDDVENCLYQYQWETTSQADDSNNADSDNHRSAEAEQDLANAADLSHATDALLDAQIVVFADNGAVADAMIDRLGNPASVLRITYGDEYREESPGRITVCLDSEQQLEDALSRLQRVDYVIHCWSLDHPNGQQLDETALEFAQSSGVLSGLKLAHVLADRDESTRVFVITRDAQKVANGDKVSRHISAPMIGMARVAYNENPQIDWKMIDLPAQRSSEELDWVLAEIREVNDDQEIAFRDGHRMVNRVQRVRAADLPRRLCNARQVDGSTIPYRVQIETPGILSNLALHETNRTAPGPHQVEAKVMAAGINFRNVMRALGMPVGNTDEFPGFGEDFAGIVTRVGEHVTHLQPGDPVLGLSRSSFRSHVTAEADALIRKPESMSFADAATISTVFATSYYAIKNLAQMRPGEKILIHAGSGGVGQAAIQIAKDMGLEIFSTAGTPEKRELLKELGVHHVMNSRTLDFVDDIRGITGGYGVDVVLNSLAADYIPKSLSVLAPFGRFVEIGKVDIYNNSKLGMWQLKENISFFVFDLIEFIVHKYDHIVVTFNELSKKFYAGVYQPLTHTDFPITDVVEAYRYMAQGKHVGKNVLTFDHDPIEIGTCTEDGALFKTDGSYLITGGASGFGLEVAKWMAKHGAGHIVLMSRSGPRGDESRSVIEKIKEYGAKVTDARGDVTCLEDVRRVVDNILNENNPPLRGVIHGAMVLQDEFIADLDDQLFSKVLRPKMNGAWNLHLATLGLPLDHFICFSSFSAVIGAPKQSNYNAGNVFLEALAQYRHAQGLQALTINWGAISGAGFVARNEKTAQYLDAMGMKSINVDEALRVIRRLLQHETPHVLASRSDWQLWRKIIPLVGRSNAFAAVAGEQSDEASGGSVGPRILAAASEKRVGMIESFIAENLAAVCSIEAEGIDVETPLTSLGLDSLMAVELMNRIEGEIGLSVPMGKVLAGPSIHELAEIMLEMMTGDSDADAGQGEGSASGVTGLAALESTERSREFPLSRRQLAIWNQHHEDAAACPPVVLAALVQPQLNIKALETAVDFVSRQHPMLRATFDVASGRPLQQLDGHVAFESHDVGKLSEEELVESVSQRTSAAFELNHGPLARCEVFRRDEEPDALIFVCHPLVADRRSMEVIITDLLDAYQTIREGVIPAPKHKSHTFQDFVAWERQYLASDDSRKRFEHWHDRLVDGVVELRLSNEPTATGSTEGMILDSQLCQRLLGLAAQQETTLFNVLFSAYELLLHQVSRQQDIIIGCTLAGRQHQELRAVVGQFANTVPLRCQLAEDISFADLLEKNEQRLARADGQQQYPLAWLVDRLGVAGADGRKSLFCAEFEMPHETTLDPLGLPAFQLGQSGHNFCRDDASWSALDLDIAGNSATLKLNVAEAGGSIICSWGGATLDRLPALYEALLRAIAQDPLANVSTMDRTPQCQRIEHWTKTEDHATRIRAVSSDEDYDVDPLAESELEAEIVAPQDASYSIEKADRVLLTGATGFLGAYLIDELIQKTDAEVVCLVRGASQHIAQQRVWNNLNKYGLDLTGCEGRVRAVVGDLSLPLLGLSEDEFEQLSKEIDVVYHNGADIDIALPYKKIRSVNVHGTHEILRLAMRNRLKPTHVVSSYAVHASRLKEIGDRITESAALPPFASLANGYSKSKWVVEHMIAESRRRGLPVSTYRPGNITGHSVSGASNTGDIMHTMVMSVLHVGAIPDIDLNIDLTPVDYVAGAIVELSRNLECLGGTYQLLNDNPLSLKLMAEWLQARDRNVEIVTLDQWREGLASLVDSVPGEVLGLMSEILTPDAEVGLEHESLPAAFLLSFDCSNAHRGLAGSDVRCHPVNVELLDRYAAYLDKVGFLRLASV